MNMGDHEFLLDNFETAGHHGYGGVDEGLCCMPGCIAEKNLMMCSRCISAQYCCKDHQKKHYKLHKGECQQIAKYKAMTETEQREYELFRRTGIRVYRS